MTGNISYTERTWGIELISEINDWARRRQSHSIRRATGESGLKTEGKSTLFPDVVLVSSDERVLMGWELKLPDTPVDDEETIERAKEKAWRLGTNGTLIWNVNEAVLHLKDTDGNWSVAHTWALAEFLDRDSVSNHRHLWVDLMRKLLADIESLHSNRKIRDADLAVTLGEPLYRAALDELSAGQALLLQEKAVTDRRFGALVEVWAAESVGLTASPKTKGNIYQSLAETQIVNWLNKILFCHYLKKTSEDAFEIDSFSSSCTADELLQIFERVSDSSDFRSIFRPVLGQEWLTDSLKSALLEVNGLLKDLTSVAAGELNIGESLAGGLRYLRGKASGQYATPPLLARLLVGLTVLNSRGEVLDPCSGSGTIPKAVMSLKKQMGLSARESAESVWASDKFNIPVGFTGVALADPEAMGALQLVFQSDVAALETGSVVDFTDPNTGMAVPVSLPKFDYVVSNLPFVRFESLRSTQSKERLVEFAGKSAKALSAQADLYAYIALGLRKLVQANGRVGLITSNSFFGTRWGVKFFQELCSMFTVEFIVSSANKRWFDNAEVVTVMMILAPKTPESRTEIVAVNKPIDEWTDAWVDKTITDLLAARESEDLSTQTVETLELQKWGVYIPSLAFVGDFIDGLGAACVRWSDYFDISRGIRPNGEKYFFLKPDSSMARKIETEHLKPLLHKPAAAFANQPLENVRPNYRIVEPTLSIEEMEKAGHTGVLEWVKSFSIARNGNGRPFPDVLGGEDWYIPRGQGKADLVLQINPEEKLAVYRPVNDSIVVSQRFIKLNYKDEAADRELIHALLNSSVSYLWQELTGFPKGLGALDRNSRTAGEYLRFPSPERISEEGRDRIKTAFRPVAQRVPLPLAQELNQVDRKHFDRIVIEETNLPVDLEDLHEALKLAFEARISVKNR